jgi:hypothetical protein
MSCFFLFPPLILKENIGGNIVGRFGKGIYNLRSKPFWRRSATYAGGDVRDLANLALANPSRLLPAPKIRAIGNALSLQSGPGVFGPGEAHPVKPTRLR